MNFVFDVSVLVLSIIAAAGAPVLLSAISTPLCERLLTWGSVNPDYREIQGDTRDNKPVGFQFELCFAPSFFSINLSSTPPLEDQTLT